MSESGSTFQAWAELSRLSNLPTVVSNVFVGLIAGYLASVAGEAYGPRPLPELKLLSFVLIENGGLAILAAVACLYIAGMMLNDLCDRAIDLEKRANRPLPSGRIAASNVVAVVALLFIIAFGLLAVVRSIDVLMWAGALTMAIVLYDLLHKRLAASVWLMGMCRGLVYLTAAATFPAVHSGVWWQYTLPLAIIMTLYTVGITYIARMENEATLGKRKMLARGMIVLPLLAVMGVYPYTIPTALCAIVVAFVLVVWLSRATNQIMQQTPQTKAAVMTWLSGMCLIDAYFLALMARPLFAAIAAACFGITVFAHRRISGT